MARTTEAERLNEIKVMFCLFFPVDSETLERNEIQGGILCKYHHFPSNPGVSAGSMPRFIIKGFVWGTIENKVVSFHLPSFPQTDLAMCFISQACVGLCVYTSVFTAGIITIILPIEIARCLNGRWLLVRFYASSFMLLRSGVFSSNFLEIDCRRLHWDYVNRGKRTDHVLCFNFLISALRLKSNKVQVPLVLRKQL